MRHRNLQKYRHSLILILKLPSEHFFRFSNGMLNEIFFLIKNTENIFVHSYDDEYTYNNNNICRKRTIETSSYLIDIIIVQTYLYMSIFLEIYILITPMYIFG